MRDIALLLPGQGAQHPGMATALYDTDPVFTAAMDEVFAALGADGARLRADWLAAEPTLPMDHVTRSQPLLFAIDLAYAKVLLDWGVRPAALLGHSIGEMAAATLAGVFTVADAAGLVWDRMCRLVDAPPGGMLAVAASTEQTAAYLTDDVVVGAVNAPRQTVLAGPDGPLDAVAARLREDGYACRRMPSMTPFHSPALAGTVDPSRAVFAAVPTRPPALTLYSGYTAEVLGPSEVADPSYWARQPVAPVLFWPALEALLATGDLLLVETGPGQGLSAIARRHPAVRDGHSDVVAMAPPYRGRSEIDALRAAAARLRAVAATT